MFEVTTDGLARHPVALAVLWGSIAAAATALGGIAAGPIRRLGSSMYDALLGFGAGVMLSALVFSLLVPAIEAAERTSGGRTAAALVCAIGILAGSALVWAIDRVLPHEHFVKGPEGPNAIGGRAGSPEVAAQLRRRMWLFVAAIAIHNVPEGFAIGVGATGLSLSEAAALAMGISIQDVPEGGVVTLSLLAAGYAVSTAVWVAVLTGLSEPLAAALGAAFVSKVPLLLPASLALAAGAMLYVVSHEIIPESHRNDRGSQATAGLIVGFVLMMLLDVALS